MWPTLRCAGVRRAWPWLALAALAGCTSADDAGVGPALPWVAGDAWTFDVVFAGVPYVDTWTVVGPGTVDGRAVVQVQSVTRGSGLDHAEVGAFDARTLALVRVEAANVTTTWDPAETWLLPPADRAYVADVVVTRRDGTTTAKVETDVRYVGDESVDTEAGNFFAHRFEVRKATVTEQARREEASTHWWAPAAANVVRVDVDGATVRSLATYALADGPRTLPEREGPKEDG